MSSVRRQELVRRPVLAVDHQRSGRPAVSWRPSSTCACSWAGSATARWSRRRHRPRLCVPRRAPCSVHEKRRYVKLEDDCAICAVFVRLPSCADDGGPL